MKDGGPAFPSGPLVCPEYGMTLRDYFAVHADQPGRLEITAAANVQVKDYSSITRDDPRWDKLPTWDNWFNSLSQDHRYELYAKVRFQIADAMLKERSKS